MMQSPTLLRQPQPLPQFNNYLHIQRWVAVFAPLFKLGQQRFDHFATIARFDGLQRGFAAQGEKPAKKMEAPEAQPAEKKKRGRPGKGCAREVKPGKLEQQQGKPLAQLLRELPRDCDRGSKSNAQGYKNSWNGYKLHLDTADCGIPVSALLSSASMHDCLAAIPLSLMTAERVTNCYDLMDAAYCSSVLREHSRNLGHVPLIDHNPRRGEKIEFTPSEAQRYKERTSAERANGRLKDDFGGRHIRVKGNAKVMSHLMFGVLALTADQMLRLLT